MLGAGREGGTIAPRYQGVGGRCGRHGADRTRRLQEGQERAVPRPMRARNWSNLPTNPGSGGVIGMAGRLPVPACGRRPLSWPGGSTCATRARARGDGAVSSGRSHPSDDLRRAIASTPPRSPAGRAARGRLPGLLAGGCRFHEKKSEASVSSARAGASGAPASSTAGAIATAPRSRPSLSPSSLWDALMRCLVGASLAARDDRCAVLHRGRLVAARWCARSRRCPACREALRAER